MNQKSKWLAGGIALLTAAGISGWWISQRPAGNRAASTLASTATNRSMLPIVSPASTNSTERVLQSVENDLVAAQTAADKNRALAGLRQALTKGSTNEITAAIRQLLDTKMDTATGQGFKIGGGGSLLEAPTLRTWLLDQLATLDPAAAAGCAREILNTSTSPDEWAIALRNLAHGDTSAHARALLETKTEELLRNKAWQREASVGYLEAFDTAVHLGGTELLSPLTELVIKKDNQAVAHAAFLTLDRLVINQPAQTLAALNEHPDWMAGREETRANYFARADIGDAAQRQLVESYLLNPSRSPAELQTFAGVFPNANFMISQNLITANNTLDGATLAQRDRASLEVVNQWLADPKFEKLREPLARIQGRLIEFTRKTK